MNLIMVVIMNSIMSLDMNSVMEFTMVMIVVVVSEQTINSHMETNAT